MSNSIDLVTVLQLEAQGTLFAKARYAKGGKTYTFKVVGADLKKGDVLLVSGAQERGIDYMLVTFAEYDEDFFPQEDIEYAWAIPLTAQINELQTFWERDHAARRKITRSKAIQQAHEYLAASGVDVTAAKALLTGEVSDPKS